MFVKNLLQVFANCQQYKSSLSRPIWKNDKHLLNSFRRVVNVYTNLAPTGWEKGSKYDLRDENGQRLRYLYKFSLPTPKVKTVRRTQEKTIEANKRRPREKSKIFVRKSSVRTHVRSVSMLIILDNCSTSCPVPNQPSIVCYPPVLADVNGNQTW